MMGYVGGKVGLKVGIVLVLVLLLVLVHENRAEDRIVNEDEYKYEDEDDLVRRELLVGLEGLCEGSLHHFPGDIRQPEVASLEAVDQLLVIEAEEL